MTTRITIANLEAVVARINRVTGSPSTPWRREGDRSRANIGNYHLSQCYGGVSLHRVCNESGGVTTPLGLGHVPKRELYEQMHAFLRGIEIAKGGVGMTTTEQRLADALRPMAECLHDGITLGIRPGTPQAIAIREALAAYDAQASRLPTEYRVTTEWDSFEALTPREAASEVWEKIKRSEGPIFTVYGRDGSVTDVDLSEDDSNA